MACARYDPDHNCECLNCDDWFDAHLFGQAPRDAVEEIIVHEMARVRAGELSVAAAAARLYLTPVEFAILYRYLRPFASH